uniref:hypothetical protein n=1 Tax=Candidatus Scatousia sp. TaxID=3085663 RepID=UPI0040259AEC
MEIRNNSQINFKAKFLHSESLKMIADYASEHGKFEKLNTARKNIDKTYLRTRLRVDVGQDNNTPFVTFTRFNPKPEVINPASLADFRIDKTVTYKSEKKMNVLKYALERIIKLGNSAPDNKMFKNVVIKK